MGIEYYIGCHKCKVLRHLGKRQHPEALADFMGSHMGHDCVLTCDLDDDFPSDGVFVYVEEHRKPPQQELGEVQVSFEYPGVPPVQVFENEVKK